MRSNFELQTLVDDMRRVSTCVYWMFFRENMGAKVHAFVEWNGVLSKYIDICARCAERGIDFRRLNVHTGGALPVEVHDMAYLGEKLQCIFGPMLTSNPKAARALHKALFPQGVP
jgi:hypothetical protein